MKFQLMAFVHDMAVLYVGTPGQWMLLIYCVWLRRRQQLLRQAASDSSQVEALETYGARHIARLSLPDLSKLCAALLQRRKQLSVPTIKAAQQPLGLA